MPKESALMRSFHFTMDEEGGETYTNDPRDPGGPTKYGVALNFNLGTIPDKNGDGKITALDVRMMEEADALVIYRDRYWRKIKTNGIFSYLKGLLDPIFIMAPINVLSEVSTPVSMAFRHFGNILSGTVISTLLYWALASLSHVIFGWLPGFLSQIQLFQIGIPAFTGLYFDWFGGCIQAFIFCTLTAIFIKRAAGED